MREKEGISVCIPAYRSGNFIVETLLSLQAQTYQNFQATISIDGNDRVTEETCQPFLRDSRIRLVVQKERLGWVQNTNWLLSRAELPYVSILPHDDLIHPYYFEELLRHIMKHPKCALVHCDTEAFSADSAFRRFYFIQPSLKGSIDRRMKRYLLSHINGVGYRSLIAKWALTPSTLLDNNPFDDFAADTLWLGKMATKGELHRLPYPLCRKRYHVGNTHSKWFQESKEFQRLAWRRHCADLLNIFSQEVAKPATKDQLMDASKLRFQRVCEPISINLLRFFKTLFGTFSRSVRRLPFGYAASLASKICTKIISNLFEDLY